MNGSQNENVMYEWSVHIDQCVSQSICIGLINKEYVTTLHSEKQTYYTYVINTPFNNWFKAIKEDTESNWLTGSDIKHIQQVVNEDTVKIKVTFDTSKETTIDFFKNNNLIKSYQGIKSQYTYQLYICMSSPDDQATINNFQTICY